MNYGALYDCDTINGKGFRVVLFVSGCGKQPKCKNCHNQKAWDFNYGNIYTEETHNKIIEYLQPKYISGLSLLGGEVMDNLNGGELLKLVKEVKKTYPCKNIMCWTGYLYEDLIKDNLKLDFIKYLDVLVDGEYIEELKDLNRGFANSSNQRIIDVQETLKQNKVVLYIE